MERIFGSRQLRARGARAALAGVALALAASVAEAQQVEEVVVTARKREEALQDVPLAVTAFSGEALAASLVTETRDLERLTPSLTMTRDIGASNSIHVTLRGQTQREGLINADPAVGIYVDGVYAARSPGSLFNLTDIQRVEVLKGPQGTLFGRNTTGGAVNVISQPPKLGVVEGQAQAVIGNYNRTNVSLVGNVPLGETLAFRGVAERLKHQGFDKDVFNGARFTGENKYTLRAALLWRPDDESEVVLRADWLRAREPVFAPKMIAVGPAATASNIVTQLTGGTDRLTNYLALPPHTVAAGMYNNRCPTGVTCVFPMQDPLDALPGRTDPDGFSNLDIWGASMTATHDFDWATAKFILAERYVFSWTALDQDSTPYPLLLGNGRGRQRQWSAELQFTGQHDVAGRSLEWLTGFYWFRERGLNYNDTYTNDPVNSFNPTQLRAFGVNRSYAVFAQGTYALTDRLNLTLGARHTWDRKELELFPQAGGISQPGNLAGAVRCDVPVGVRDDPAVCLATFERTFKSPSWNVTLDYKLIEGGGSKVMAYATVASGFRSGGVNARSAAPVRDANFYDPEKVISYEIGLKGDWLDRRLRTNFALYYQDYKDIQQAQIIVVGSATATVIFNAQKAHITGAEAEIIAAPIDNLDIALAASTTRPVYDEFLANPSPGVFTDRSGEKFVRVPRYQASVSANYRIPVSYGQWRLNANYGWRSKEFFSVAGDAEQTQKAVGLVNARLGVLLKRWDLEISLWGKNLGNKNVIGNTVDLRSSLGFASAVYDEPRTWGADLVWRFGG
jgi:iron complex outermembrane recepter protein